jgi:hypothetical protein
MSLPQVFRRQCKCGTSARLPLSIALLLLLSLSAQAQGGPRGEFAKVEVAREFVRALFPETTAKDYVIDVTASTQIDSDWNYLSDFDVSVGPGDSRAADSNPPGRAYWKKPEVLGALFRFRVGDPFIGDVYIQFHPLESKLALVLAQVNAHQGWSDSEVAAALRRAGARFGPNDGDALRNAVPIDALEPFIGKLEINSSEFFLRHEQKPRSLAELYWEVDGGSVLPNGRQARWTLILEPFEGRLQSLTRGR